MSKLLEIAKRLRQYQEAKGLSTLLDVDQLDCINDIMEEVAGTRKKIEGENARHKKNIGELQKEMGEIQSRCRHEVTTYQGDPSGGSDSCRICDICGSDFSDKGYRRS